MNILLLNNIIALWLTALTSLSLGIFVLIKGPKNINRQFAFYSFSIAWWSSCHALMIASHVERSALIWVRIGQVGVFFIPTFFLHFTISFLKLKFAIWKLKCAYFLSILFAVLSVSRVMGASVAPKFYVNYFTVPGVIYHFAVAYFFVIVTYCLVKLFKEYNISTGPKKNQLGYLCWSSLFGYVGGLASFFFVYNINVPILNPFGTYAIPFYVGITVYAIFRHQLMDITIVIRKTAIYSILATVITVSYFLLIYIIEGVFRGFLGYKSAVWTLSVIAVFTLIFQPLKNLVQDFVDKYFFKGSLIQELEKAQEELKRTERLKAVGTLAAGMAHEIKNPLTGIKTFTEYLPAKGSDPEFRDKFYKIVSAEVSKINDIVQQLLDFSKPRILKLEQCDIYKIIDQVLSFLNNDFINYNITIVKNYDPSSPLLNLGCNQIKQVFLNLLLNAIDSMKEKGGTLTIGISGDRFLSGQKSSSGTCPRADGIEISISDTGKGISEKDLEHIFDPFFTTKETGTGLGMSIVYGIIKEHKGEISVSSEAGVGTKVVIKLPIGL